MNENPTPRFPRLRPGQRRLYAVAAALSVYVFANALYLLAVRLSEEGFGLGLFALSDIALPKFHQAMVLSHTAVGVLLAGVFSGFAYSHARDMWKRNRRAAVWSGVSSVILGGVLAGTGLFILSEANSSENAWAWWIHVILAGAVPGLYVAHRQFSRSPLFPLDAGAKRGFLAVTGLCAVMLCAHLFDDRDIQRSAEAEAAFERGMSAGPGSRDFDRGLKLEGEFRPAISVKPGSPFFPSSATTTSGDWMPSRIVTRGGGYDREQMDKDLDEIGFVANVMIGAESCVRCHPDVAKQWASSAHRFSSFNNPWYEATITDMRETANSSNPGVMAHVAQHEELADQFGVVKSNWCSGCHDPAVMLAGKMNKPIDRRSAEAQAGLTCLACHAIDKLHGVTGNGGYNIADEQEDPYLFPDARSGMLTFVHDAALQAKPTVHKKQMLKDFHKTSEFCASCHKVSLDQPVNSYRWIRGQNEYDNWHDSGISKNAARTFYLPPAVRNCQECHMPMVDAPLGDMAATNGKVRDHRFVAANTALPFLRGDAEMIKATEDLLKTAMRVEIFAAREASSEAEPVMGVGETALTVPVGRDLEFHVVVRNKGVGHTFPGGTIDSNEGWLELSVASEGEQTILSGFLGEDLHVDPAAHFYRGVLIGEDSEKITRRNAQDIRLPVYANLVGPGTADIARYKLRLPEEWAGREVALKVRLLWRKFDQRYNEFAFEKNPQGFPAFDKPPVLPVTEMATHEVKLVAAPYDSAIARAAGSEPVFAPDTWMRFNDYAIGLLLDGDTVGARRAFEKVRQIDPKRRDGWVNLARVALADGNVEKAIEWLRETEKVAPGHAMTAYVWGQALHRAGEYGRAANAFRRTLEEFPQDRDTLSRLAIAQRLDKDYQGCLETLDKVLAIDPEDRIAHYHRMLALRSLGDHERAAIAEKAYEKYSIDESAREWVKEYAIKNPLDQLHTQPIFLHDLTVWPSQAKEPAPAMAAAGSAPGSAPSVATASTLAPAAGSASY
jgi:tetratricopeptide (TPR) repeat protein